MSTPNQSDYLWDRSGTPDAEEQRLEALLAPFAPKPPRIPRRRRGWLAAGAFAVLTFMLVFLALPPRAIPSRVAGLFHDDFPGEIGVRGGTRVEYRVVADAPDLDLTNSVADDLRARGANVVLVRPGSIIIDLVGVERDDVRAWSRGIGASGKLSLTMVKESSALMRELYALVADDEEAHERGLSVEIDTWRHDPSGQQFMDYYLVGPDAATVSAYLAERSAKNPGLLPGPDLELVFEPRPSASGPAGVRTYLVEVPPPITQADIADAYVTYDQNNQPQVIVELTRDGGRSLANLTRGNYGRKLAILVDGEVESAPVIMGAITGGRFMVAPAAGIGPGEAEGLAAAFRQGTLSAPLQLVSATGVEPVLSGPEVVAARALFAFPFALFTFLIAFAIARFAPRIDPAVFRSSRREGTASGWWLRLLVTLAGAAAAALSIMVPLPGINAAAFEQIGADSGQFSIFAFGLRPMLTAFVLVEVVALLVPRWRRLRISGAAGRSRLAAATVILTLILAGMQAWFLVTWLASMGDMPGTVALLATDALWPRATVFLSLICGTLLLILLAAFVSRRGFGNGYVVVILGGMAHEAYLLGKNYLAVGLSATTLGWLALFTAAVVGATSLVLRLRVRGGESRLRLQLPTCGFVPLSWTVGLFALVGLLATMHLELPLTWLLRPDGSMSPWLFLGVAALLAVGFSLLFSLPVRFESIVTLVSPKPAPRYSSKVFWAATLASMVILVAMAGLYLFGQGKLPEAAPDVLWLAIATAGIMDIIADARARHRNSSLVAVWPIHRVQLTDVVIDALANRGIDAHAQGLYFRKLFYLFAPFVPILIMVAEDRAEEARSCLASMLGSAASPDRQAEAGVTAQLPAGEVGAPASDRADQLAEAGADADSE